MVFKNRWTKDGWKNTVDSLMGVPFQGNIVLPRLNDNLNLTGAFGALCFTGKELCFCVVPIYC